MKMFLLFALIPATLLAQSAPPPEMQARWKHLRDTGQITGEEYAYLLRNWIDEVKQAKEQKQLATYIAEKQREEDLMNATFKKAYGEPPAK